MKNLYYLLVSLFLFNSCQPVIEANSTNNSIQNLKNPLPITNQFYVDSKLNEISGLLIAEENFWGFNDSGGEPEIYLFRKEEPQIIKTVRFKNVKNDDFEIITENDSMIFVGDAGNNRGQRKNLKFLYFNKNLLNNEAYQEIEVDTLSFFYPEQKDYSNQNRNHNFDLEGAFFDQGKLHLFTKQWKDLKTRHFTLDIVDGRQPAWLQESYDVKFLITDAAITYKDSLKKMAWVGYNIDGQAYLLTSTIDKDEDYFFKGLKNLYPLGFGGDVGQIEGVAFKNWDEVCYSAEAFDYLGAQHDQNITCLKLVE